MYLVYITSQISTILYRMFVKKTKLSRNQSVKLNGIKMNRKGILFCKIFEIIITEHPVYFILHIIL